MNTIRLRNARLHNLKGIDVDIPKGKLVVITGVSGSGKSTLAFDLIYAEGRRRYLQLLGEELPPETPGFDELHGLSPAVAVEQRILRQSNPRSTVGTRTRIYGSLQALFALASRGALPAAAFSPNTAQGMCLTCFGRGQVAGAPDQAKVLRELEGDAPLLRRTPRMLRPGLQKLAAAYEFDPNRPFRLLSDEAKERFLNGCDRVGFEGRIPFGQRVSREAPAGQLPCPSCRGYRLGHEALGVTIGGLHIGQVANLTLEELAGFLRSHAGALGPIAGEMLTRVGCLIDVGLAHLSLWRGTPSLSGGELQRLFLAAYLNADLDNLLYVFDEPSVGLHELEKARLVERLRQLQAQGNSVLVVEHDLTLIEAADHIIEIGPGAGRLGGQVVYQGDYPGYRACQASPIVAAITGEHSHAARRHPVDGDTPRLTLHGARTNNLRQVSVSLPLGVLVGVAGVSGSGKSTLIAKTLVPMLAERLGAAPAEERTPEEPAPPPLASGLTGWEQLRRLATVTQLPIGRNRSSTPASYLGLWDRIRAVFARQPGARALGLTAADLSFNSAGACPACSGEGATTTYVGGYTFTQVCQACEGTRFRPDVLTVAYNGCTAADLLGLTAAEALPLFAGEPAVQAMLQTLCEVGLGYLTLGQPSTTLSGGEAQRIKLAKELGQNRTTATLYVLDEPTTGLSAADTARLMALLGRLVDQGHSVIVIEHDPAVLSACDWIVELGPGAGSAGGEVVAEGPPALLRVNQRSLIGPFLKGL